MKAFDKIYLYARSIHPEDVQYVLDVIEQLKGYNIPVSFHKDMISAMKPYEIGNQWKLEKEIFSFDNIDPSENNLIIVLGGDGTILHVVYLLKGKQIPVLGINLGRLGFLAGVKKTKIKQALTQIMNKDFYIDERSLIGITSPIQDFEDFPYALNEFTIRRLDSCTMINISLYIEGKLLNSYWADGLLISTPTGSTAYSLSCGGPILFPNCDNFVITAVAPHNLSVRPIVIPDNKKISLHVKGRADNFMITLDSRHTYISKDQKIVLEKAPFNALLVYVGSSDFMKRIQEKLHWGEDIRN